MVQFEERARPLQRVRTIHSHGYFEHDFAPSTEASCAFRSLETALDRPSKYHSEYDGNETPFGHVLFMVHPNVRYETLQGMTLKTKLYHTETYSEKLY
jgi:hypothetical protein